MDVSTERSSPRGYAFFIPLGGGERSFGVTPTFARQRYYSKTSANQRGGQGRLGQNAGIGSAGRGGFRRRDGGIRAAGGTRGRVLRTQSVGAAEAEKIPAAAEKSASAAEKVAGEEKRREQGPVPLESVRGG